MISTRMPRPFVQATITQPSVAALLARMKGSPTPGEHLGEAGVEVLLVVGRQAAGVRTDTPIRDVRRVRMVRHFRL